MKTPETEAVLGLYNETVTKNDLVLAHFARRLERERNEAREDLSHARQKLEAIAIGLSPASMAIHCGGDCSKIPGSLANLILECGAIAASGNSRMNAKEHPTEEAKKNKTMNSKTELPASSGRMTRLVRVVAWVEIMGNRAETTFTVESPWVCEGACPVLQRKSDEAVAAWVFQSQCKSGFAVETAVADDYNARDHESFYP